MEGIFSLFLVSDPVVILADHNLCKEAMSSDPFLNRASMGSIDYLMSPDENGNRAGLLFSNGKEWQEQRRFSSHHLKCLGFGSIKMEPVIIEEVKNCVAAKISSNPLGNMSIIHIVL